MRWTTALLNNTKIVGPKFGYSSGENPLLSDIDRLTWGHRVSLQGTERWFPRSAKIADRNALTVSVDSLLSRDIAELPGTVPGQSQSQPR